MDTIRTLEEKLAAAKRQIVDSKYPTGMIIDVLSPLGNIFCLTGICKRTIRYLGLSNEEREEFLTELNAAEDYKAKLEIMRRWFGIVFTGLED